jgi:hypothetical protein
VHRRDLYVVVSTDCFSHFMCGDDDYDDNDEDGGDDGEDGDDGGLCLELGGWRCAVPRTQHNIKYQRMRMECSRIAFRWVGLACLRYRGLEIGSADQILLADNDEMAVRPDPILDFDPVSTTATFL